MIFLRKKIIKKKQESTRYKEEKCIVLLIDETKGMVLLIKQ